MLHLFFLHRDQFFVEWFLPHLHYLNQGNLLRGIDMDGFGLQTTNDFIQEFTVFLTILLTFKEWQYGLWNFQTGGTKLQRFLHKNQHTQRKLLKFEF